MRTDFSRERETFEKKLKKGLQGSGGVDLGGRILTGSALKKTEHGGGELGVDLETWATELKLSA